MTNIDNETVDGFGEEWERFDQTDLSSDERKILFERYFEIFPWELLNGDEAVGFDLGCGSGRWARLVAPRVGYLHCIDPSNAVEVARRALREFKNCGFHRSSVDQMPMDDNSMDFGYSLGVLHHIPNTSAALKSCVAKLKPGAPFLIYLYYSFDNRPGWFRLLWRASDVLRKVISRLPKAPRFAVSQIVAAGIYWPLARMSRILEIVGINVDRFPLSAYRHQSFYTMRTDALDRFGTRLEQRFSRVQITEMMYDAGLEQIRFSNKVPYWVAVGIKGYGC